MSCWALAAHVWSSAAPQMQSAGAVCHRQPIISSGEVGENMRGTVRSRNSLRPSLRQSLRPSLRAACAVAGLIGLTRAHADPQFTILDLGSLGGTNSQAFDINNAGQVI